MQGVKMMPYSEKYAIVLDKIKSNDVLISPFIQKHLGEQALVELQKIWQEGIKPVPEDAPDKKNYEITYGNLMWRAKSNLKFIRMHLGEDGIEQYKLAQVEELKRKNSGPALLMLGLLRAIAPRTAFTMIAREMAYKLQWLTPFSLVELTKTKALLNIPRCKVIGFPDMEEVCIVDCQAAYPMWVTEQFKIGLKFNRRGDSCNVVLTL